MQFSRSTVDRLHSGRLQRAPQRHQLSAPPAQRSTGSRVSGEHSQVDEWLAVLPATAILAILRAQHPGQPHLHLRVLVAARERAKAVPGCCARRFYSSRMASSGCALPPASPSVTHVSLSIPQAVRLGTGGVRREQWRMQSMYQPYGGVRTVYALRGWWKRTNDLGFGDAVFSCV